MSKEHDSHGQASWFAEREARREASGALLPEQLEDQDLVAPLTDERPIGQNTDDRQIGQYNGEGNPPRMKK